MAREMGLLWITTALLVVGCHATGEFSVLYSPDSLKFSGSDPVGESFLKDIFSASLGLSVDQNSRWTGLTVADPFNTPEAVVNVFIDGLPSLGSVKSLKKIDYPIIIDDYEPEIFMTMRHRIKQRFNEGNDIVAIHLSDENQLNAYQDVFGVIDVSKTPEAHYQYLKESKEEDKQFLMDIAAIKAIAQVVSSGKITPDGVIDFYDFRCTSLHALSDFYGPSSKQVKEALPLLANSLEALSQAFQKAYEGSVLVTVVTSEVVHSRRYARATSSAQERSNPDDAYSQDYAAIFNIILWFSVVFVFSMLAIVYAIMDMDPGRDSIIYRMTTMKTMKKEN